MKAVTPVEITPALTGWQDVDVSAYVGADAGSVVGVLLEIVNNTASTEQNWGVRKNGSTDALINTMEDNGHTVVAIGVDNNDIFEANIDNTTNIDIYLLGYIVSGEGSFFTNAVDKSLSVTGSFQDIDISADTGGDTALVAFLLINQTGTGLNAWGLRCNGSTDNLVVTDASTGFVDLRGAMINVDNNEIFEMQIAINTIDCYLVGYLTANVTTFTNRVSFATATAGAYEDADLSGSIPSGNNGAFYHFFPGGATGTEYAGAIRKNGSSYDIYRDYTDQQFGWTEIDSNRVVEQKIESANLDLWLWGYTSAPAGGGTFDEVFTVDGVIKSTLTTTFTVDGVIGSAHLRYFLNSVGIPRPSFMRREFVQVKSDLDTINGRTTRDFSAVKEKFILRWDYLSQDEIDSIMSIVNLNTAVTFQIAENNLTLNSTSVLPFLSVRDYPTPAGSFYEAVELELVEVS